MKKIIIGITFCVVAFVPLFAFAQIPFGGLVTSIQPCDTGLLLYVREPLGPIVPFMWFAGELPFLMHVVPHPGQWLLGEAALAPAVCFIGPVSYGAGFPIEFHGSSL